MNLDPIQTAMVLAATGAHRRGGHGVFLAVLLVLIAAGVGLVVQRRRDRRPIDASGTAHSIEPEASSPDGGDRAPSSSPTEPLSRPAGVLPPGHYRLDHLLRSEWTKLRTVRSTTWTLGMTVVIGIGISALATAEVRSHLATTRFYDPTRLSLTGTFFCQLVIGVLGVLVVSAEYSTGTVRATFAAAPRRPLVLLAKVLVFGSVVLVVSEIVAFVSFLLGQALLSSPAAHADFSTPGALTAVVGTGLYLCLIGLFALALAVLIRHTAGAISTFVFLLLVLPLIVQALPNFIQNALNRYLLPEIGSRILNATNPGAALSFSPWAGFGLLCGYTLALLLVGGVLLVRRDA